MAHMHKCVKADVFGLAVHYERREGCKLSNKEIDETRTHLNYNLADSFQPLKPEAFVSQRVSEVKSLNRANVIHMVDWIITLPKNVPASDERMFFEHTFNFVANRYGKENIVCGWVHNDETTPHIHISFVPITKKDGLEKLSCKDIMTRNELKSFHPDLASYLEEKMNYLPEIQNVATINGSRSVKELKAQEDLSLKKSLSNMHKHIDATNKAIEESNHIQFETRGFLEKAKTLSKANNTIDELTHNNQQLVTDNKALMNILLVQKTELDSYRSMPLAKQLQQQNKTQERLVAKVVDLQDENAITQQQLTKVMDDNKELKAENMMFKSFIKELGITDMFKEFAVLYQENNSKIDFRLLKNIVERTVERLRKTLNKLEKSKNKKEMER